MGRGDINLRAVDGVGAVHRNLRQSHLQQHHELGLGGQPCLSGQGEPAGQGVHLTDPNGRPQITNVFAGYADARLADDRTQPCAGAITNPSKYSWWRVYSGTAEIEHTL